MNGVNRNGWAAYALGLLVIVLDQLSKAWVLGTLPINGAVSLVWPLRFTHISNAGVSFGLFQGTTDLMRWGFVAFSLVVAVLLAAWARRQARLLPAIGLGLIVGGAIGNAIDRARFGSVVDFIDVQQLGFFPWIFNVADSAITVGVVVLLLDSMRRERPA
jgi:signal peptidase II